jgi:hypothetical protein
MGTNERTRGVKPYILHKFTLQTYSTSNLAHFYGKAPRKGHVITAVSVPGARSNVTRKATLPNIKSQAEPLGSVQQILSAAIDY